MQSYTLLLPYKEIDFVMLLEQSEECALKLSIRVAITSVSTFVIGRIGQEFEFAERSKEQIRKLVEYVNQDMR
jgi:hypothetical protein